MSEKHEPNNATENQFCPHLNAALNKLVPESAPESAPESKPRAFCVEPHHLIDESKLEDYEVVYMFDDSIPRPSIFQEDFPRAALARLEEMGYDAARDYVVVTAHMVPMVRLAAAIMFKYDYFPGLYYHVPKASYVAITD